jgi:CRP-like cAMP-binding protein
VFIIVRNAEVVSLWETSSLMQYNEVRQYYLDKFQDMGSSRLYNKNKVINFSRGENILLVREGRVKVSTVSESGNEKILYILSEGDLVGEIEYFNKSTHDYDVTTLTKCSVQVMETNEFHTTVSKNRSIYEYLIKSIIRKFEIVTSQLTDNVFKDAEGKIASVLVRMASQEGKEVDGHIEYFYLKHQDMADLLGCSRVTITKTLKKFRDQKIIDISDNKIKILHKDKLLSYI